MKRAAPPRRAGLVAALLAWAASTTVGAHSWIESASVVAPNGSFVGAEGFPRGHVPRSDPGFSDKVAQHQLPEGGVYRGDEVLNKFPPEANPRFPLLQATPGSIVAIRHLENGHVTLPQAQANKPLNRGTVYLYGTSQPRDRERLLDVHLVWNRDGTGGDGRGRLLATRNYDDGQCFQDNKQALAQQRASRLAAAGARVDRELQCQTAITVPPDARPDSVYTVYWYWDWPTLNPQKVDMEATRRGQFPWAGSFMRGDAVSNGWTMDAITVNESYASVIDIKVIDRLPGVVAKEGADAYVDAHDVYGQAIKAQMASSFDVAVDGLAKSGPKAAQPAGSPAPSMGVPAPSGNPVPPVARPVASSFPGRPPAPANPGAPAPPAGAQGPSKAIVTVPPSTVLQTVYVTDTPGRKAKRGRAPLTTMVARTKQASVPGATLVAPSEKHDGEPEPPRHT